MIQGSTENPEPRTEHTLESTTAAGIALLSLVGAGLTMGTTLAAVLLRQLHLDAQAEHLTGPGAAHPAGTPEASRPVAELRA